METPTRPRDADALDALAALAAADPDANKGHRAYIAPDIADGPAWQIAARNTDAYAMLDTLADALADAVTIPPRALAVVVTGSAVPMTGGKPDPKARPRRVILAYMIAADGRKTSRIEMTDPAHTDYDEDGASGDLADALARTAAALKITNTDTK